MDLHQYMKVSQASQTRDQNLALYDSKNLIRYLCGYFRKHYKITYFKFLLDSFHQWQNHPTYSYATYCQNIDLPVKRSIKTYNIC